MSLADRFIDNPIGSILVVTGGLSVVGSIGFVASRYRVASSSQYVVRTGLGIDRVAINKKAVQWPFQKARYISMSPHNYSFELSAMSREKMEFKLPGVFTIGPEDNIKSLEKCVTLLNSEQNEVHELIKGIIEGETRVLAAALEIEDIFNGRDIFRDQIITAVQEELEKFGLKIYNANIKELEDTKGSEYFVHMRQRKKAEAENQARKDVAMAQFNGDVAVKEKDRDTRVQTAQFESDAVLSENSRNIEIAQSKAEYNIKQAEYDRMSMLARIETDKAAEIRRVELQKEVEIRNISQQTEKLRSELLSRSIVEAEAKERAAEANLYAAQKEAEGTLAQYEAQANGLKALFASTSDPNIVLSYLMIKHDVYPKLADANAKAIQGLQPKITSWVTSGDTTTNNPMTNIMKNIPPLVSTIHDQTGIKPPFWLMDTTSLPTNLSTEKQ